MTDTHFFEPDPASAFSPQAIIAGCFENGARAVLLDQDCLPPDFFDLSTGVAGDLLHRLSVYQLRLAAVVPEPQRHSATFQAFVCEANRGAQFRFYATRTEALAWLAEADG
jgi:hypothetical protein